MSEGKRERERDTERGGERDTGTGERRGEGELWVTQI